MPQALIIGAGDGLSASLARLLAREGYAVALAARNTAKLAALAAERLGEDPFSGVVLVFRAKRGDRVKIVHWDASGLVLVWKQLEGGAFRWPAITDGTLRLSAVQFAALFAGLDFSRVENARQIPRPTAAA